MLIFLFASALMTWTRVSSARTEENEPLYIRKQNKLNPANPDSFFLQPSCSHVKGSIYTFITKDCYQYYHMRITIILVVGITTLAELVCIVFPFYFMKKRHKDFSVAFAWTVQILLYHIGILVTEIILGFANRFSTSKEFVRIMDDGFTMTLTFSLFAQAMLVASDMYDKFKNMTYKDLLISAQRDEPLTSYDTENVTMQPFAKILVCWGLGLAFGLLMFIIGFIRNRDEVSETIHSIAMMLVVIVLLILLIPFYVKINIMCGVRQRHLSRAIEAHFNKLSRQQRPPKITLTYHKNELRRKKTRLYCKLKESVKIYKATWPIILLFGFLPQVLAVIVNQLRNIGVAMEKTFLEYHYDMHQNKYDVILAVGEKLDYHDHREFGTPHTLIFIADLFNTTTLPIFGLFIIVIIFTNDYYHVYSLCYARLFAFFIAQDVREKVCGKKAPKEEEVRVSNEAWEVKLAFTKMTPKRGSSGGGTTARGDTSGSDSNSKLNTTVMSDIGYSSDLTPSLAGSDKNDLGQRRKSATSLTNFEDLESVSEIDLVPSRGKIVFLQDDDIEETNGRQRSASTPVGRRGRKKKKTK